MTSVTRYISYRAFVRHFRNPTVWIDYYLYLLSYETARTIASSQIRGSVTTPIKYPRYHTGSAGLIDAHKNEIAHFILSIASRLHTDDIGTAIKGKLKFWNAECSEILILNTRFQHLTSFWVFYVLFLPSNSRLQKFWFKFHTSRLFLCCRSCIRPSSYYSIKMIWNLPHGLSVSHESEAGKRATITSKFSQHIWKNWIGEQKL